MSYTENDNIGILILIVFWKAFDSVSWSEVQSLKMSRFKNNVINWKTS